MVAVGGPTMVVVGGPTVCIVTWVAGGGAAIVTWVAGGGAEPQPANASKAGSAASVRPAQDILVLLRYEPRQVCQWPATHT
jgi:hypothetical protein